MKILICLLMLSVNTFAANKTFKSQVNQLVDQYYTNQVLQKLSINRSNIEDHNCVPSKPECLDVVCNRLGSFGCDSTNDIIAVSKACRGNVNGLCVDELCSRLGSFGCDSISEATRVAQACIGNDDAACVNSVCTRLGSFGCDSISEVETVAKSCAGL